MATKGSIEEAFESDRTIESIMEEFNLTWDVVQKRRHAHRQALGLPNKRGRKASKPMSSPATGLGALTLRMDDQQFATLTDLLDRIARALESK